MLIESEFEVPGHVEDVWAYLLEVQRVAPCMPGAELTEVIDERSWKGKVNVKLGPVSLSFAGTVTMTERDDEAHRVSVKAMGMEQRGKGAATAVVTAWAEAFDGGTKVRFTQDLTVSGAVAQFSRGMMQDVSGRMTRQFAECLKANLEAEGAGAPGGGSSEEQPAASAATPNSPAPSPARVAAKPVGGLRRGLWALWRAVVRFFRRLFGGRTE